MTDEILIRTVQPQNTRGRNFIVNYTITVPDTLELQVSNITGVIRIESIKNTVVVNNITGEIDLDHIVGSVDARVITGVINGRLTVPLDGTLNLSTMTGKIDVDIPSNSSADCSRYKRLEEILACR